MNKRWTVFGIVLLAQNALADDVSTLAERGEALFTNPTSCWVCHGDQGEGRIGPSLHFGPTPYDIHYQLTTNPQMAAVREELKPTDDDLLALAVYIRQLGGADLKKLDLAAMRGTLNSIARDQSPEDLVLTPRDKLIQKVESFDTVLADWQRRAKTGSIKRDYAVKVTASYDGGEAKFKPEPGKTYFYENIGTTTNMFAPSEGNVVTAKSSQIVVGDAVSKEIITSYELVPELRGLVHTTVMSPDGKYVYIIGAKPYSGTTKTTAAKPSLSAPATLIKADAITLQPIKQMIVGGRVHHGQIFQDKYLLLDTFARDVDGLDVFLLDPETDQIVGGIRDEELGGSTYTAWTDDEFIYVLMEPSGYAPPAYSGYLGAIHLGRGKLTTMRPFWVAKIDPSTWEVVKEYPYPAYRGDWIVVDAKQEYMYIPSGGSSNLTKINLGSGKVEWVTPTGIGPYGANLNADESEIWVADKGETTGMFGRTITVIDAKTGQALETLFSAYQVDHVLLAPNGEEFWITSNGEGRIYVYDAKTREQTNVLDMPNFGDPHGLVWVHYDASGTSKVVRDQGGFHNGINPATGNPLKY